MSLVPNKLQPGFDYRLSVFYYLIGITAIVVPLVIALIFYTFPEYFDWVLYPDLFFKLFLFMPVFEIVVFGLHMIFKNRVLWYTLATGWISIFFFVVYLTGAAESTFTFLLVFPILVSATRLYEKEVEWVSFITIVGFSLMIFAIPGQVDDPSIVTRHIIHVILFSLLAFYIYRMVKETLRKKYIQKEEEKRLQGLMEVNGVKENFLTVASHQLRTPLNGARWNIDEVIKNGNLTEDYKKSLTTAQYLIERSISIVGDLTKAVETDTEKFKFKYKKEHVNLLNVLEKSITNTRHVMYENKVSLDKRYNAAPVLEGDANMLEIAFTNIIDNAALYSPHGHVSIILNETDNDVVIKISDTGLGIRPGDLAHIFDQFYRGKNAISTSPDHSGVGLAIAQQIIEKHGGRINVTSEIDKGTTVLVYFPVSKLTKHS